jgi:hypothetical protein
MQIVLQRTAGRVRILIHCDLNHHKNSYNCTSAPGQTGHDDQLGSATFLRTFHRKRSLQRLNNPHTLAKQRRDVMRLRRNQICPIHRSFSCCGREVAPKVKTAQQFGVRRIEDPLHPRGYRELRSNGEMRKLLDRKIVSQGGKCGICCAAFTDYSDIVPDHISPKGMGGAWRDDHPENIQAVHWWCNGEKGSSRR